MRQSLDELSILIVTWNGDALLKGCLDSLVASCGKRPEIVVVDNANLESTRFLATAYDGVRYVASERNLGFAGGNNLGFPLCTREYVLLLNNDTIVHEEPFSAMIEYLESHPRVSVVQGKLRLALMGDVLDSCGEMLTPFGVGYDGHVRHSCRSATVSSGPVYFAKGALLMMRRSIVDELGGVLFYDFFQNNYEEADFCFRVWLSGNEVHFVNTPIVDHLQGQSIRKLNQPEMAGRSLANMWFSLCVNLEGASRWWILPRLLLVEFLVWLSMVVRGQWNKASAYCVAVREIRRRKGLLKMTRKRVQSMRKRTDGEIFKSIMVRPGLSYFYYLFRGSAEVYTTRHLH